MTGGDATFSLAERVLSGDARALAKAATLIESQANEGRDLISFLFSRTGAARIIGVTGSPGAGKSTLVNQITRQLRSRGDKVGIIAVDPSSPYSHGAILGDRIRLAEHHADPGVFVRSMATRGKLGGVAYGTVEIALLLDAAGFDTVLIETVGVGQDEVDIAVLADVTIVVLVPGLGDDVQAMKAGIMEIADVLVINKADLPGADRLEAELQFTQTLVGNKMPVAPAPIVRVVASDGSGIEPLLHLLTEASRQCHGGGIRKQPWLFRLREMLRDSLLADLDPEDLEQYATRVAARVINPYEAVAGLRDLLLEKRAKA